MKEFKWVARLRSADKILTAISLEPLHSYSISKERHQWLQTKLSLDAIGWPTANHSNETGRTDDFNFFLQTIFLQQSPFVSIKALSAVVCSSVSVNIPSALFNSLLASFSWLCVGCVALTQPTLDWSDKLPAKLCMSSQSTPFPLIDVSLLTVFGEKRREEADWGGRRMAVFGP